MDLITTKLTPEVYSKESRDFQLIARLYDAVFNNIKMGSDIITSTGYLNDNFDPKLLSLAAYTNGFISKHIYDNKDLYAILSSFKAIIKEKGTKNAIETALKVLLKSQSIKANYKVTVDLINYQIKIFVDYTLKDLILLKDLFEYILPTGFTYRLYSYSGNNDIPTSNITLAEAQPVTSTATTATLSEIVKENASDTSTQAGGNINSTFVVGGDGFVED